MAMTFIAVHLKSLDSSPDHEDKGASKNYGVSICTLMLACSGYNIAAIFKFEHLAIYYKP